MLRRIGSIIVLCVLLVGLVPVQAQTASLNPRAWVPADFAGFIALRTDNLVEMFTGLNMGTTVISILQPTRPNYEAIQSLDMLFPLPQLDLEDASFTQDVLPWLGDEMIIAYREFGDGLTIQTDDLLFILPARDALQAASSFSRIAQGQDLLREEKYQNAALYLADKTTFAIAPEGVIIGEQDQVKAVLDLMAGEGGALIDSVGYEAIAAATPENALVTAYLDGSQALSTLSFIMSGSDSAEPLLAALGQALRQQRGDAAVEQVLLGDELDGVGLHLEADTIRQGVVRATLSLYDADRPVATEVPEFNTDLLTLIPQNAMIIQNGTDAAGLIYDVLYALPLTNFSGQILGAFPVPQTAGSASGLVTEPTAADIERAVENLTGTLEQVLDFNLEDDLLSHLGQSYSIVMLPRPNNPTPFLNTPYDVLILTEVEDGDAVMDGITLLSRALLGWNQPQTITLEEYDFQVLGPVDSDPVLSMGMVEDMLLIATGDALQPALDAQRGDNQLISRPLWDSITRDGLPQFYVNIPSFYSTFLPMAGGATLRQGNQLGARTIYRGDGLYQVNVIVTLPGELG